MENKDRLLAGIISGDQVARQKLERAKELRHTMTPAEKILWQHLRAHRLNGLSFRRQQVIEGFIVDFYCHAAGVVVEVDGPIHEDQKEYDAGRDRILSARGLQILRIANERVSTDLAGVLVGIRELCEGRTP